MNRENSSERAEQILAKTKVHKKDFFTNEHGNTVTVLSVSGNWCMCQEGKKKPFVLSIEFVLAHFNA
jgi:hypothetical protein